jgi:hypothetical protein
VGICNHQCRNTCVRRGAQTCFRFRWKHIWVDATCLKMGGKVSLKLWVKLGCSPQYTQMVLRDEVFRTGEDHCGMPDPFDHHVPAFSKRVSNTLTPYVL